jgi:predicted Na+-dependent transporter
MSRWAEIGAHALLFFLVFGMSATVDIPRMKKQMRNRSALLIGIALQFVILPFVGFCIVKLLNLSAPLGITLLVVTSSPGGSYSNCKYQRGFVSSLLSLFIRFTNIGCPSFQ